MWRGLTADQGAAGTGAKTPFSQGRVMGGRSSIMGMIALRGQPGDYDGWAGQGASGWGWNDVLPYFRRRELDLDFGGEPHGTDGPVRVHRIGTGEWPPFCRAVGQAAADRGWQVVADMNVDFGDGYCQLPLSVTPTSQVSAAAAYLDADTRTRPNLHVESQTTVEHLRPGEPPGEPRDPARRAPGQSRPQPAEPPRLLPRDPPRAGRQAGPGSSPAVRQRDALQPPRYPRSTAGT